MHNDRQIAASMIVQEAGGPIDLAVVLGSGLTELSDAFGTSMTLSFDELPGFPKPRVEGHEGSLACVVSGGKRVALLKGRSHYYEGGDGRVMAPILESLSLAGTKTLILTNSAGSLNKNSPPGSIGLIEDHINYSGINPLIGAEEGPQFLDMSTAYDADLLHHFRQAAIRLNIPLGQGVYIWFSGPSFETPAEIRMAKVLGADYVGMSTVPEVILARGLGFKVAALSAIVNWAAGLQEEPLSHEQTQRVAAEISDQFERLLVEALSTLPAS